MTKISVPKFIISLFSLCFVVSLWFLPIDQNAHGIVNDSLKEALIVFGVAKGLNAAVSIVQGTQFTAMPGFVIAIGEALDPLNDLIEQFSWVMLASITSLGIQKIISNIVTGDLYTYVLIASLLGLNIWLYVRYNNDEALRAYYMQLVVVLLFLRLAIPLMSVANIFIYEHYVKQDYNIEKTHMAVNQASIDINTINSATTNSKGGFLESITEKFDTSYYKQKLAQYESIASNASDNILNLMVAFIFKTILFPIIFLFLLYKLLKNLFGVNRRE